MTIWNKAMLNNVYVNNICKNNVRSEIDVHFKYNSTYKISINAVGILNIFISKT